jgi:nitrite reductase/ring-hydroxylating ferredoxin subunit
MSNSIKICPVDALSPGEMRCVSLADRNVLVAHTEAGFMVADEMCTHEDARLCDGNLNGTLVKCPLHGSRFDLTTGRVLDDPAEEDLRIYPVTIVDGDVCISIEQSAS